MGDGDKDLGFLTEDYWELSGERKRPCVSKPNSNLRAHGNHSRLPIDVNARPQEYTSSGSDTPFDDNTTKPRVKTQRAEPPKGVIRRLDKEEHKKGSDEEGIEDLSRYGGSPSSMVPVEVHTDSEEEDINPLLPDEPKSLVAAIQSLEKSIRFHCKLLNRKAGGGSTKSKSPAKDNRSKTGAQVAVPATALRSDKVRVFIRVVFLKLGEIDTMKENFAADAFIQARWREEALDRRTDLNPDVIKWEHYWNPKIYVENNLGEPKETIWQTLVFNAKGEATVYERRRIKGCFLENLELDEFPFDTQDLTLTVTSERSEAELDLDEDNSEISSINVQSFVDEQEWRLHSHVETWRKVTTRVYQNSKYKHPALSTSCRASRRPGFFIWNIFLVMLFICSLAFATFTVDVDLPQNRLQLSFILLLTTITFKFVVSQTLPRISYLTYLDKYILTSMGILCAVCVWHSVVPRLAAKFDLKLATTADFCALIILGGLYFMFHVIFFLYIYFVALKKRWTYNEKDMEHRDRMKKLQKMQENEKGAQMSSFEPM